MIATALVYRNTDRIISTDLDAGLFVNQLYYSRFDSVRGRWSDFQSLFEHQEGHSYGHPAFFNNGKSLIFSSDREGGYGGMDLYMTHWDEQKGNWGEPVNMGRAVNTEGDEIYPRVVGDALYFASNGMEGFGSYDIYRMSMVDDILVPGTLSIIRIRSTRYTTISEYSSTGPKAISSRIAVASPGKMTSIRSTIRFRR